ncbi:MAG: sigma-70 family RNA polymerase sigma factor [Bryobacteraceae bacterium]|nr:sigma-70 family RNA polymerase sigma factor [Bryobacteraceae bacterium]
MMTSFTAVDSVPDEVGSVHARAALEQRFERILASNRFALARLAGGYTDSASDRDDLLQDIAMSIWQALPGFRGECSERTFVFRIAHNRAITYLTRNRSRLAMPDEPELADNGLNPEAALVLEERGNRLARADRALPIPYRQVVLLTLEEMEYNEIALVLGISESNVGVRLSRARQMLRRIMEGQK